MVKCSGTWRVCVTWISPKNPDGCDNISGFVDDNPQWRVIGGMWTLKSAADGRDMYPPFSSGAGNFVQTSATFTPNSSDANCQELLNKYDCLNGNCVKASIYNTPGQYATLEECRGNCGGNTNSCKPPFQCIDPENFCPPGKTCLPQDEWNQILGLIAQNKAKHCK